jgi:hypothetical protein
MATTTEKQGKKDWTDFFLANGGGGVLQKLFDDPLDVNDEITMSYVLDNRGLLDTMTTYPFNWILIP